MNASVACVPFPVPRALQDPTEIAPTPSAAPLATLASEAMSMEAIVRSVTPASLSSRAPPSFDAREVWNLCSICSTLNMHLTLC